MLYIIKEIVVSVLHIAYTPKGYFTCNKHSVTEKEALATLSASLVFKTIDSFLGFWGTLLLIPHSNIFEE